MLRTNKHTYSIDINGGSVNGFKQQCSFKKTRNINMVIGKQKASVSFLYGPYKTDQDFIGLKDYIFRDILRKAYLLHILLQDEGLIIKEIDFCVDEEKYHFDKYTPYFPFVFSMMSSRSLKLDQGWKDERIISYYATQPKTISDDDDCNCAAISFLASKTRRYETDRFLNLWTAMNAYYNSIAKQFERTLENKGITKTGKYKVYTVDNACLGALICTRIKKDYFITKDFDKKEEYIQLYRNTNRLLVSCVNDGGKELYEKALTCLDNEVPPEDPYYDIFEAAKYANVPLFIHLLVLYPYLLRCKFFHGSKVQPVISGYKDPELFDLRIINQFLETFLNQKIPTMFFSEAMDDESFETVKSFCEKRNKK